ncbi:futalosine hydrolase [Flavitalea antarctica]
MNILLVSATDMETATFRESYHANRKSAYKGIEISFLTSGIGMLATAARLTAAVLSARPDVIIQAGIAGSFSNNLALGDVYRVASDLIADMGVNEQGQWKDVFDLGLAEPGSPPYQERRLMAREPGFLKLDHLPAAIGVSVNEITTDPTRITLLKHKYGAELESMEGAALHFVGLEQGIPFIQLRAVSNYIGERDKANWRIREAITNLNNNLEAIIKQMAS